jgi:hypothetical protein
VLYSTVTEANVLVGSNSPQNCSVSGALKDGGHNLSFPDTTCPGINGNPKPGPLQNNGGPTATIALHPGSAAIDKVPLTSCPKTDQRGVKRPDAAGTPCDIGAFEFAIPTITIRTPAAGASYEHGSREPASYSCAEGGITSPIATCEGTAQNGKAIDTSSRGTKSCTVTATDKTANRVVQSIHYTVTS